MEIIIDAEFKDLIPPLTLLEKDGLKKSLIEDGCLHPLVVWKDILLDGYHRHEICTDNNIEFKTIELQFEDKAAAKIWMINHQLGKRNLNNFQRCELVAHLEPLIAAKAKEKQQEHAGTAPGKKKSLSLNSVEVIDTQKEMAKKAQVGCDTIYRVKKIIEKASDKDKEKLRNGEVSINQIFLKINPKERKEKDPELFDRKTDFERRQVSFADSIEDFRGTKVKDKYQHLFKNRPDAYWLFVVLNELPERISKADLTILPENKKAAMLEALIPALTAVKECLTKAVEQCESKAYVGVN